MTLNPSIKQKILDITKTREIQSISLIQPLWNNYGSLCRVFLKGSPDYPSVIIKHIQLPEVHAHPRGFATSISRQRKIQSYQVETKWYQEYNQTIAESKSPTPNCLGVWTSGADTCILLEDLNTRGFTQRLYQTYWKEITVVLDWLAHFHAQFLHKPSDGLWECGTYWHLETRPDELKEIEGTLLHRYASFIDSRLQSAKYQTIVHGDAKLANFCFTKDQTKVAAVDFQYVGKGCGMKDLAYFISSCLSENESERLEAVILDHYFNALRHNLANRDIDPTELEVEWRALYPLAIADFQRFILGWSPSHQKNNNYTQRTTDKVVSDIADDLTQIAIEASLEAGQYILGEWKGQFEISSKGMGSAASDIVTEVDRKAQDIIVHQLKESIEYYNLGLLAEEGEQDDSRLYKHAFWTIDPIDGTLFFTEGLEGFAVSIALVSHSGESILGVVYDPVNKILFQMATGQPLLCNGKPFEPENPRKNTSIQLFLDRSFKKHPWYEMLNTMFETHFVGGAVMNVLNLLKNPRSFYMKAPKKRLGGCAIWDLAAVSLFCEQIGGSCQFFDGSKMHFNRKETLYFNDVGFVFTGSGVSYDEVMQLLLEKGLSN